MRTVHAFNQEQKEIKLYDDSVVDMLKLQYKEAMAKAAFYGMVRSMKPGSKKEVRFSLLP